MKRLAYLSAVMAMITAGSIGTQAQAFIRDSSQQKVIMIGKGGSENMQQVQVTTNIRTTPTHTTQAAITNQPVGYQQPVTTTYSSQPAYQGSVQPYNDYTQYSQSTYNTYSNNNNSNNNNSFDRLAVTTNSAAVLVYDMQTGQPIYEKNVDARRSIASITKVMTAMVVLDAGQDMREELTISSEDLRGAKQASTRLKAGDRLSRSEFMLMMLMKSENPAAKTLASHYPGGFYAFVDAMNQKAQSLGMTQTRFSDSSGLDPRNVSSANDLAKMMREVAKNPSYQTISNFSKERSYDFYINNYNLGSRTYSAANTSSLVRSGGYPIGASKTGFIREAGYCVVMETHVNGRPAIVVLLGANASQTRWKDAENILGSLAYRY